MKKKSKISKLLEIQDVDLEQIYDFVENGNRDDAPNEIVVYLDLMDKIRGMHLRVDRYGSKDAIVNHLIKVDKLSRYMANKAFNQAMEYFYSDVEISRSAWLNIIAAKMEKNISLAQMLIKDPGDAAKVNKMLVDLRDTILENYSDEPEIPDGAYDRPNKIYTMELADLGKKPQSRKELAETIDKLPEVTEKVKEMAKRHARLFGTVELFPEDGKSS